MGDGLSLMEEGARLLLRGLMAEMEPTLRELEGLVEDLNAYHPPEILPNGDIIIRRKVPLTPEPDSEPDSGPDSGPDSDPDTDPDTDSGPDAGPDAAPEGGAAGEIDI